MDYRTGGSGGGMDQGAPRGISAGHFRGGGPLSPQNNQNLRDEPMRSHTSFMNQSYNSRRSGGMMQQYQPSSQGDMSQMQGAAITATQRELLETQKIQLTRRGDFNLIDAF